MLNAEYNSEEYDQVNLEFHWAGVVDHGRQIGMDVQRRALMVFIEI